jgi:hypothetical protein
VRSPALEVAMATTSAMAVCHRGLALEVRPSFRALNVEHAGPRPRAALSLVNCYACLYKGTPKLLPAWQVTLGQGGSLKRFGYTEQLQKHQKSWQRQSDRRLQVVNRAAEGFQSTAVDQPPSSREEAILQAKTALQSAVGKFVARQGRRKGGINSQLRVQVEVSWGLKRFYA